MRQKERLREMLICKKKSTRSTKWVGVVIILLSLDIAVISVFSQRVAKNSAPQVLYLVGLIIANIFISVLLACLRYAYNLTVKEQVQEAKTQFQEVDAEFLRTLTGLPTKFTFKDLESATQGFSKKLGKGGFGSVYEGTLPDGTVVAVKRLEREGRGQKEFCAEVATISRIRHANLVCLKGFCVEGAERLLVYEFMPRGSLDRWIFHDRVSQNLPSDGNSIPVPAPAFVVLSWETRFSIALHTAKGLAYLHEDCEEKILHLDIKPQNILLDDCYRAKVSDFGLSRSMDKDESRVVTTMRGTPGYLAPEWFSEAGIDNKADVYSYGMVVLELVSGRRNMDQSLPNPDEWFLPALAIKKLQEGLLMDIVDPLLASTLDAKCKAEALLMIHTALWCIQEDPSLRPMMSSVVQMLDGNLEVKPPPVPGQFLPGSQRPDPSIISIYIDNSDPLITIPR